MSTLELQGVHKRFGDAVALRSLDLAVASGEFISLLGPSGCGKTTALRIVAGFELADSGRVLVDGKDISHVPANKRDMGMVFQAYSLFPNLTAQDNVAFGLRAHGMLSAEWATHRFALMNQLASIWRRVRGKASAGQSRRARELLDLVGLGAMVDRYPHQLSGGQQQRVALARALAIEPSVLLLDEPLSALDAQVRVQLRNEIRRIQTQLGITTLFVTHDQEEALSISDRVVVLSHGQIEQAGTPAEIYSSPRTAFVAQFVGTMNRIAGVVAPGAQGWVQTNGTVLRADAARTWAAGAHVLLLIRPESITLERSADGGRLRDGAIAGTVRAHTFLGSVTRLNVTTDVGDVLVDVGSADAFALSAGADVSLAWDPRAPQLVEDGSTAAVAS